MDNKILLNVPLFKGLNEADLDKVLILAFVKEYKKGFTLFFEGMQGGVMYVILEGAVDLLKKDREGNDNLLATISKGDYMGELSLIDDDSRSATAKISEDSKMLVITRKIFNDMMSKEPEISLCIAVNIIKKLSERLKAMNEKMIKYEEK